jgi:hypothetical protein
MGNVIEGFVMEEAKENRVHFVVDDIDHLSFTGFAQFNAPGGEDEDFFRQHDVEVVVGSMVEVGPPRDTDDHGELLEPR